MSDENERLTRRGFLAKAAAVGALTVGAGYLSACKPSADTAKSPGEQAGGGACDDLSALTDAEKSTREGLGYVDKSTVAGKNCKNCSLYQPEKYAEGCGGCTVMKGPVLDEGYCTAWALKPG